MTSDGVSTRSRGVLDPDSLAALEEERDFLLRSLEDLDREFEAGDIDQHDYETLRNDYTHRAAEVLRAIEHRMAARASAVAPVRPRRIVVTIAGVLVFAALAGLGVARAAGDRSSIDGLTGDVRPTIGQMLFRCNELAAQAEILDALKCYDDVLEEQPGNVEATASKGWTLAINGLPNLGWPYLAQAVAIDPEYSDALVWSAVVLNGWCRPDETLATLDAFDASQPLAEVRALVDQAELRERATELLVVRLDEPAVAAPPVPIAEAPPGAWDQCPVLVEAGVLELRE